MEVRIFSIVDPQDDGRFVQTVPFPFVSTIVLTINSVSKLYMYTIYVLLYLRRQYVNVQLVNYFSNNNYVNCNYGYW